MYAATIDELQALGFIEGRDLIVDERGFGIRPDELSSVATQLAQSNVDVILAGGALAIGAAQAATPTIPIIGVTDDMVREGHVSSMANHGGNTTGISILAPELDGKRQQILIEVLPTAHRMAVLTDSVGVPTADHLQALQASARTGGVELVIHRVDGSNEIGSTLDAAKAAGAEAVNILASAFLNNNRQAIFAKAMALRLPTIFQWPEGIKDGAFLAYGPRQEDVFRRVGQLTGKVLRGTNPAELPVEQPTRFELAVNLKVARELGITLSPTFLLRADRLIE
jgi:putative ABC transport system substrate-binding protein